MPSTKQTTAAVLPTIHAWGRAQGDAGKPGGDAYHALAGAAQAAARFTPAQAKKWLDLGPSGQAQVLDRVARDRHSTLGNAARAFVAELRLA